jgi:hypothetical protein
MYFEPPGVGLPTDCFGFKPALDHFAGTKDLSAITQP